MRKCLGRIADSCESLARKSPELNDLTDEQSKILLESLARAEKALVEKARVEKAQFLDDYERELSILKETVARLSREVGQLASREWRISKPGEEIGEEISPRRSDDPLLQFP
jgi:hypothetical protein